MLSWCRRVRGVLASVRSEGGVDVLLFNLCVRVGLGNARVVKTVADAHEQVHEHRHLFQTFDSERKTFCSTLSTAEPRTLRTRGFDLIILLGITGASSSSRLNINAAA